MNILLEYALIVALFEPLFFSDDQVIGNSRGESENPQLVTSELVPSGSEDTINHVATFAMGHEMLTQLYC